MKLVRLVVTLVVDSTFFFRAVRQNKTNQVICNNRKISHSTILMKTLNQAYTLVVAPLRIY